MWFLWHKTFSNQDFLIGPKKISDTNFFRTKNNFWTQNFFFVLDFGYKVLELFIYHSLTFEYCSMRAFYLGLECCPTQSYLFGLYVQWKQYFFCMAPEQPPMSLEGHSWFWMPNINTNIYKYKHWGSNVQNFRSFRAWEKSSNASVKRKCTFHKYKNAWIPIWAVPRVVSKLKTITKV